MNPMRGLGTLPTGLADRRYGLSIIVGADGRYSSGVAAGRSSWCEQASSVVVMLKRQLLGGRALCPVRLSVLYGALERDGDMNTI